MENHEQDSTKGSPIFPYITSPKSDERTVAHEALRKTKTAHSPPQKSNMNGSSVKRKSQSISVSLKPEAYMMPNQRKQIVQQKKENKNLTRTKTW